MRKVKTKALISSAVTAQLICAYVFAYAKSRFSHGFLITGLILFAIKSFSVNF